MNINPQSDESGNGRSKPPGILRWLKQAMLARFVIVVLPFFLVAVFRVVTPPVSAFMVIKSFDGNGTDYRWRSIEEVSPHLVRAVITSEDARFCSHKGVDWKVMDKLVDQALSGNRKRLRGGSTLTMQTAKNLFLWPGRSYVRKAIEMALAYWIDLVWPKSRVIEVYLNIAEWAPGVYGAEAAARYHFGRSAARLTPTQAALLAASLPNPAIRNAGRPGRKTRRAARRVSARVPATVPFMGCLEGVLKKR